MADRVRMPIPRVSQFDLQNDISRLLDASLERITQMSYLTINLKFSIRYGLFSALATTIKPCSALCSLLVI